MTPIWPQSIKTDHGSTSWLSGLIVAASLVAVETDEGENLCRKSRICVWSLVCWSCYAPFCRPFFLLLYSPVSFPLSWGVGSGCFSTSCGRLQGPPRTRCWCQVLSCLSYRHPCSAAVEGGWGGRGGGGGGSWFWLSLRDREAHVSDPNTDWKLVFQANLPHVWCFGLRAGTGWCNG